MDRVESVFNKMKCSHYIWHYSLLKPDLAAYAKHSAVLVRGDQTKRGQRASEIGEGKEKERKGKEWTDRMDDTGDWSRTRQAVVRSHDWQLHRWPLNDLSVDMLLSIRASEAIYIRVSGEWGQIGALAHLSWLESWTSGRQDKSVPSLPKPSCGLVCRPSSKKQLLRVKGVPLFY